MAIQLDHLILAVNDRKKSVEFYVGILGLKYEGDREPFSILRVTPDFTLQLAGWGTKGGEHLAFAMSRKEFDEVFRRVVDAKIEYGDAFDRRKYARSGRRDEPLNSAGGGARGRRTLLLRPEPAPDRDPALRGVGEPSWLQSTRGGFTLPSAGLPLTSVRRSRNDEDAISRSGSFSGEAILPHMPDERV